MGKYRRGALIVEAEQFVPGAQIVVSKTLTVNDEKGAGEPESRRYGYTVQLGEKTVPISPGDWIVTDERGERHICKKNTFYTIYQPVN